MKYELQLKKESKIKSKGELAKLAGSKGVQVFYNLVRLGPRVILRSTFQLLRANLVTRLLSALFLIFFDVVSLFRRRISLKQFILNFGMAAMLLVGGTVGWNMGTAVTEQILMENAILALMGGILGAAAATTVLGTLWEKGMGMLVQDDATEMLHILNQKFNELIHKYELSEEETLRLVEEIAIDKKVVQEIYASPIREETSHEFLQSYIKKMQVNAAKAD